jgi:hypothetical protein
VHVTLLSPLFTPVGPLAAESKFQHLVPRLKQNVVGTKWVFHNKQDEHAVVTRNKARLVEKGYAQVAGLYFEEFLLL